MFKIQIDGRVFEEFPGNSKEIESTPNGIQWIPVLMPLDSFDKLFILEWGAKIKERGLKKDYVKKAYYESDVFYGYLENCFITINHDRKFIFFHFDNITQYPLSLEMKWQAKGKDGWIPKPHPLTNTLINLKGVKKLIEDSDVNGINVYSHLPGHIWEAFEESINNLEKHIN